MSYHITVTPVPYRFDREQVKAYHDLFKRARALGRKLTIFATAEAREKIKLVFPLKFTEQEMSQVEVRAYPSSMTSASNLARGMTNCSLLFIDDRGRFTDVLKQTLVALDNVESLIVFNDDLERPER